MLNWILGSDNGNLKLSFKSSNNGKTNKSKQGI